MSDDLRQIIFLCLLLVTVAYALIRGGKPERLAAGIFVGGIVLTAAAATPFKVHFLHLELALLGVDTIMLAAFVWLALRSDRFWPLWLSAIQLLGVILHLPILLSDDVLPTAYYSMQAILAYPMLLILMAGTRRHRLRVRCKSAGSWRAFFGHS